ncbi:anti-repressor SinI family protein [Bacillus sp. FJAT-29790]|uniref:anti-repressor SinI family protein n=1 Tax=Bacillus sp. FJAT-29790 TaxID=1895002 RepID=UPI001C233EB9|nr:anti-repressor SinI family protein [Bacillus sp. FJAT-29790]
MIKTKVTTEGIDSEWLQLILEAKNMGMQKEEILAYLSNKSAKDQLVKTNK